MEMGDYIVWKDDGMMGDKDRRVIIQVGKLRLSPTFYGTNSPGKNILRENLSNQTVHFEINLNKKTFNVKGENENVSEYFKLEDQEVSGIILSLALDVRSIQVQGMENRLPLRLNH